MTAPIKDPEGFTLLDWQKKVIQNDILMEIFNEDMERRGRLRLQLEKFTQCMRRLREEWVPILQHRGLPIPNNDQALADLIFFQTDYKNRTQRDAEAFAHLRSQT